MSTPFDDHFPTYLTQAREAQARNQSHDFRRQLFLDFLRQAFGIEAADVDVEQYIRLSGGQTVTGVARIRKGWIDAVFGALVFEFKRDVEQERADGLRELRDYLTHLPDGATSVGLLTDGLAFEVYVLDDSQPSGLRQTDSINLGTAAAHVAYQWLDAYLLRQRDRAPTAEDIVRRFGVTSPTFTVASHILREALAAFGEAEAGALEVKRQQWAFHLARVYGSADVTNDEMFVRHTYLCQFAKLLAYTARFGVGSATEQVEGIVDGAAFEVFGISNIGEQDFFAWVTAPEARSTTFPLFRHLIASLAVYDLSRINEDLLKQLYQSLVGAETRHELGEFYTPDWLAELTLRTIAYQPGQSLLDPACGSGAFLFTALRLLADQGLTGAALVDFALENVMGMDVHPLAVTIAKINYLLALLHHLQQDTRRRLRAIPIALANSLQAPSLAHRVSVIEVPFDAQRAFYIPASAASHPTELTEVLAEMGRVAEQAAKSSEPASFAPFGDYAMRRLPSAAAQPAEAEAERLLWIQNARYLADQIQNKRDTIWSYVLQNTSRPLVLSRRKFDVVVGNPPWIAYRYLLDRTYQAEVKQLARDYSLLASGEVKLHPQLELSAIFYEHCWRSYLRPGGTLAFVMPRSVLTGAKHHRAFQLQGFSQVLDLDEVTPLFNVPTCVLVRTGSTALTEHIPTQVYEGRLPAHECPLSVAGPLLTAQAGETSFVEDAPVASPYYFERMLNGATLYPRNLTFVTSAQDGLANGQVAHSPIMRSDPDLDAEAKAPWKGLRLKGYIDDAFLYATVLSKEVVPFGIRAYRLVALPVLVAATTNVTTDDEMMRFTPVALADMADGYHLPGRLDPQSLARSATEWFLPAEALWQQNKKKTSQGSLAEWLNYQGKITAQSPAPGQLVLYGATGSNLAAVVADTSALPVVGGVRPKAFVVDHMTYWYKAATLQEAHFLVALLNAPCVDAAIKRSQTRGLYGPRHIHRRPFEVCPIPPFDAANPDHLALAALSLQAHKQVKTLSLGSGGVVAARKQVRTALQPFLRELDIAARTLLGIEAESSDAVADEDEQEEEPEEAETAMAEVVRD